MKNNIHPVYNDDCKVTCASGNTFITGSTKKEIKVEVCAVCHPFFTGEQKFVDTEGRVEKFMRKRREAEEMAAKIKAIKEAKKKRRAAEKAQERPKSLKELLEIEEQKTAPGNKQQNRQVEISEGQKSVQSSNTQRIKPKIAKSIKVQNNNQFSTASADRADDQSDLSSNNSQSKTDKNEASSVHN